MSMNEENIVARIEVLESALDDLDTRYATMQAAIAGLAEVIDTLSQVIESHNISLKTLALAKTPQPPQTRYN
jgi:prefoldin subunit 5